MAANEYLQVDPCELLPHPLHERIYGDEPFDAAFAASIDAIGQLTPVSIVHTRPQSNKYRIIGGHRIVDALGSIGKKVDCVLLANIQTELDEAEALVELNRTRQKKPSQIYQELKVLKEVYQTRAQQNSLNNLKKGVSNSDTQNSATRELVGEVRIRLQEDLGIGRDRLRKIEEIGDMKESGDARCERLMKKLDGGESVDSCYQEYRIYKKSLDETNPEVSEKAQEILNRINDKNLTPAAGKKQLSEYEQRLGFLKNKSLKLPPDIYNVILADPPLPFDQIMAQQTPFDKDCVLFVWTKPENLTRSLEVMNNWGFFYRSMAILDKNLDGGDNWVDGSLDILIVATSGKWLKPEPEHRLPVKIPVISEDKSYCVFEIIENMFPHQKYFPMWIKTDLPNWLPAAPKHENINIKNYENDSNKVNENLANSPEKEDKERDWDWDINKPSVFDDAKKHELILTFEGEQTPEAIVEACEKKCKDYLDNTEPSESPKALAPPNITEDIIIDPIEFAEMYAAHEDPVSMCDAFGITMEDLQKIRKRLGFPPFLANRKSKN
jgi:N6-adenosine-specific RNA methylase IME4